MLLDSLSSSHSSVGSNIPGVPGTDSVDADWEELEDSAGDMGLVGAARNRENLEGREREGRGEGREVEGGERSINKICHFSNTMPFEILTYKPHPPTHPPLVRTLVC